MDTISMEDAKKNGIPILPILSTLAANKKPGSKNKSASSAAATKEAGIIRQIDLAEERLLAKYAREAVQAHREKREMIQRLLDQGAQIEEGSRSAHIRSSKSLIIK